MILLDARKTTPLFGSTAMLLTPKSVEYIVWLNASSLDWVILERVTKDGGLSTPYMIPFSFVTAV